MGRLGNISGKDATKAFGKAGWQVMGQVGSHVVRQSLECVRISQSHSTKSFQRERCEP